MKCIGITQRVEMVEEYGERRDCLDQCWAKLVMELGYIPIPLPNIAPGKVSGLVGSLGLHAIFLSGGNNIGSLDPLAFDMAPERDAFETALLDEALKRDIPLVGVCRGMQMINVYFGGALTLVDKHVAVRHSISALDPAYHLPETTNSYHNSGITPLGLGSSLKAIATDSDGNIEAFRHMEKKLLGIMWHPERERPFNVLDIKLLGNLIS